MQSCRKSLERENWINKIKWKRFLGTAQKPKSVQEERKAFCGQYFFRDFRERRLESQPSKQSHTLPPIESFNHPLRWKLNLRSDFPKVCRKLSGRNSWKPLKLIVFAFEVNFEVRMLSKQPQTAIKATPPARDCLIRNVTSLLNDPWWNINLELLASSRLNKSAGESYKV